MSMSYLKPSELTEHSIIVIEFNSGKALIFFINKCVTSTLAKGAVCIYGRTTNDLIEHYKVLDIENEKDLTIYLVTPPGSKVFQRGVKGYRKLTTLEKQYFAKEVQFLNSDKNASAKKMFSIFQKVLFRSKVSRSFSVKKDQFPVSGN
jgi:hypothetical protein